MNSLGGHTLQELSIGMKASLGRTVTETDLVLFAAVSGDTNPVHLDAEAAATTPFKQRIAHGMLSAGFISAALGTRLPGPGCIYISQNLRFKAPVHIGDTVRTTVEVTAIDAAKKHVTLATICTVADRQVLVGEALMLVSDH